MTVIFVLFRSKLGAIRNERYVIASQCVHWRGNPFPALRSNVSAQRADNVTPINDNFSAYLPQKTAVPKDGGFHLHFDPT